MTKKILVIGAAGNGGRHIIDLLFKFTDTYLVLADRNQERLTTYIKELDSTYHDRIIDSHTIDVKERDRLELICNGIDIVVVASSTVEYIDNVINAVIKNGCDYLDIQCPVFQKYQYLYDILNSSEIKQKIITDCGAWPGTLLPMVNYCARYTDTVKSVRIYGFFNLHWSKIILSPQTIAEMENFYDQNKDQPAIYKDGVWISEQDAAYVDYEFPKLGKHNCSPTFTRELYILPKLFPSINEISFYKNFGDEDIEKNTIFVLEFEGYKSGNLKRIRLEVSHENGYAITGAGMVGCIIQCLEDHRNGIFMMGEYVDPMRLFDDYKKFGLSINIKMTDDE